MYLTKIDESGCHNFVGIPQDVDGVYIDEGHWEDFIRNPQYLAKKKADRVSYAWDRLIEHFTASGEVGQDDTTSRDLTVIEPALRVLASEPRFARRYLAAQLLEALHKNVPPGSRFLRVGYSIQSSETVYVFLIFPQPPYIATYEEYREARRALLLVCCKVAKLRATNAARIVGLAAEPAGTGGGSEDLVLLDVRPEAWGVEQEEEARRLQSEAGIMLDENVEYYERHDDEYPEVPKDLSTLTPAARLLEKARLRRLAKLKNKKSKGPH